jgi:hypothetical protein
MDEFGKIRDRSARLAKEMRLTQKALSATARLSLHLSTSKLIMQLAWSDKTRTLWNRTHTAFAKLFEMLSKNRDASPMVTELLCADDFTQINLSCNKAMRKQMRLQQKRPDKETLDDSIKAIVKRHCDLLKNFLKESRKWGLPPAQSCGHCSACRINMPRRLIIGQFDLMQSLPAEQAP